MPLQTYSQGMAMRLAFAVTTHFSNRILVMDEWIGAGDAQFREKIVARMNGFVDAATIMVVASHSNGLLRRIATKADRKSVVEGKRVSVRVDLGGRRIIKKNKTKIKEKIKN